MPQIGEGIWVPAGHDKPHADCPFCPEARKKATFTTYPGKDNDSGDLAAIMGDPGKLTSRQPNARPKDGSSDAQDRPDPRDKPEFRLAAHGEYSFEAHHAISGKQAMKNELIEHWICADRGRINADSGYSINNTENGVWLPSVPSNYQALPSKNQKSTWGGLAVTTKQDAAFQAMKRGLGQFHKGPHNVAGENREDGSAPDIEELDDIDPANRYDTNVKKMLANVQALLRAWNNACTVPRSSTKPQPNWRVNALLDNTSTAIIGRLTGPVHNWRGFFISNLSREYYCSIYPSSKKRNPPKRRTRAMPTAKRRKLV